MKEYHKIETLFKRDPKTKKLAMGEWANDTFKYLKDNEWQFTEKVDGTNIRIYWDGHKVAFGGRTDNAQIPAHLINRLNELFGGEANAQLFEQKFGDKEVELFGEGYGIKIQNGGLYRNDVDFILFDVMINDNYLPRDSVEDIAIYFGLDVVPILLEGCLYDGVEYVLKQRTSTVGKNGALLEGLVGRPKQELRTRDNKRVICKIKYCDFN